MTKEEREETIRVLKLLIPKGTRGNGKVVTNIIVTNAILNAINIMHKYQKIEEIYYHQTGRALEDSLRSVIEDGNDVEIG